MFNTSRVFSQETCIEVFSNIDIFIETYEIIEKLDVVKIVIEEGQLCAWDARRRNYRRGQPLW